MNLVIYAKKKKIKIFLKKMLIHLLVFNNFADHKTLKRVIIELNVNDIYIKQMLFTYLITKIFCLFWCDIN